MLLAPVPCEVQAPRRQQWCPWESHPLSILGVALTPAELASESHIPGVLEVQGVHLRASTYPRTRCGAGRKRGKSSAPGDKGQPPSSSHTHHNQENGASKVCPDSWLQLALLPSARQRSLLSICLRPYLLLKQLFLKNYFKTFIDGTENLPTPWARFPVMNYLQQAT